MARRRFRRPTLAAPRASRWAILLLVVLVAMGAVACGGGDDSSSKASKSTATKPGDTAAPPTTVKKSDAKPLDGGICNSEQLVASQQVSGLTTDQTVAKGVFALLNNSTRKCTLTGYPTLQLSAGGTAIPTNTVQGGAEIPAELAAGEVSLDPGASASFLANWVFLSTSVNCPSGTKLAITPPGNTKAVEMDTTMTLCDPGTINVSPMQAGVISG